MLFRVFKSLKSPKEKYPKVIWESIYYMEKEFRVALSSLGITFLSYILKLSLLSFDPSRITKYCTTPHISPPSLASYVSIMMPIHSIFLYGPFLVQNSMKRVKKVVSWVLDWAFGTFIFHNAKVQLQPRHIYPLLYIYSSKSFI